jgi:hypothetical protein
MKKSLSFIALAVLSTITIQANAAVAITEVSAFSSGANPPNGYSSDWFELTNLGSSAVNIAGWKMDDDSLSFASGAFLTGITNIAAGESVLFINTAVNTAFVNSWFNGVIPAGLQIGNYVGGPGLGQGGDAVSVFNSAQILQAVVSFGTSGSNLQGVPPYSTFDNAAGLNNVTLSTLSTVGVNGAFVALNNINEIGSPGRIAAPIPEADSYAMLLAGLGFMGFISRRRKG